ncbi:uncharacterized protein LOC132948680 [Metopolophium dirhodum]|uniref:uncharacterized protein LOC132948680 n=1 Tax=Metopolophium dirhodum TaxID=44670 RepID=UPI00298FEAB1|nr:uncharacterized protein LOC132948680 [Metopolophium dirhodum]
MEANVGSSRFTQSFIYSDESRCFIDALDLAGDHRNTTVGCLLRRGLTGFRSTPELTTDSSVNSPVVQIDQPPVPPVLMTSGADDQMDTLKCLQQCSGLSVIEALDLAVDRRITTTVGIQLRPLRENAVVFRSSAELSIHSPMYGPVKSAVPLVAAEIQPNPARSDGRTSLWKRSKKFMRESMVNFARRICFCQSFVDLE